MVKTFFLFLILCSFNAIATDSKLSVDVSIDKLLFQKPPKGIGKAGVLIFKSANILNNGVVLNINNSNNQFDSQIFARPTFLGFTTQFGNYGFNIEPDSVLNIINKSELENSKLILDDNNLNISGKFLSFINTDSSVTMKTFRLYCQSLANLDPEAISPIDIPKDASASDMIKNCFSFLTLNGNYAPNNEVATLEYEGVDQLSGDKTFIEALVRSFDLRSNQINANLKSAKTVSNNSYFINANEINLNCAKDEDLRDLDFNKIKKTCLNQLKIAPMKASITDKSSKSTFNLDIKDITIKNKIVYFALNSGTLSDTSSTTYISNLLLNCKKDIETDLLDVTQVLKDCIDYARLSIANTQSTKPNQKDSSLKKIVISSTNGAFIANAEVTFAGIKAPVAVYGKLAINKIKRQLIITVSNTKLPLGINSVKLLMFFLKNNLISKDITILNNVITITV